MKRSRGKKMTARILAWMLAIVMMVPGSSLTAFAAEQVPNESAVNVIHEGDTPEGEITPGGDSDNKVETPSDGDEDENLDTPGGEDETDSEDEDNASEEDEKTSEEEALDGEGKEQKSAEEQKTAEELPEGVVEVTEEGALLGEGGIPLPNPELIDSGDTIGVYMIYNYDIETPAINYFCSEEELESGNTDAGKNRANDHLMSVNFQYGDLVLLETFNRWTTKGTEIGAGSYITSIGNPNVDYLITFTGAVDGEKLVLPTGTGSLVFYNTERTNTNISLFDDATLALALKSNVTIENFDTAKAKTVSLNGYSLCVRATNFTVEGTVTGKGAAATDALLVRNYDEEDGRSKVEISGAVSNIGLIDVCGILQDTGAGYEIPNDRKNAVHFNSTVKGIGEIVVENGDLDWTTNSNEQRAAAGIIANRLQVAGYSKVVLGNGASIGTLHVIEPDLLLAGENKLAEYSTVFCGGKVQIGSVQIEDVAAPRNDGVDEYFFLGICDESDVSIDGAITGDRSLCVIPVVATMTPWSGEINRKLKDWDASDRSNDESYLSAIRTRSLANDGRKEFDAKQATPDRINFGLAYSKDQKIILVRESTGVIKTLSSRLEGTGVYVKLANDSENVKLYRYDSENPGSGELLGVFEDLTKTFAAIEARKRSMDSYWIELNAGSEIVQYDMPTLPVAASGLVISGFAPHKPGTAEDLSTAELESTSKKVLKFPTIKGNNLALKYNLILENVELANTDCLTFTLGGKNLYLYRVEGEEGSAATLGSIVGDTKNSILGTDSDLKIAGAIKTMKEVILTGKDEAYRKDTVVQDQIVQVVGDVGAQTLVLGSDNLEDPIVALEVGGNQVYTNIEVCTGNATVYTKATILDATKKAVADPNSNPEDIATVSAPKLTVNGSVFASDAPLQVGIVTNITGDLDSDALSFAIAGIPCSFAMVTGGVPVLKSTMVAPANVALASSCLGGCLQDDFSVKKNAGYLCISSETDGNVALSYVDAAGNPVTSYFDTWAQAVAEITALKTKRDYTITLLDSEVNYVNVKNGEDYEKVPTSLKLPAATVVDTLTIDGIGGNELAFTDAALTFNSNTVLQNVTLTPYVVKGAKYDLLKDAVTGNGMYPNEITAAPSVTKITCKGELVIGDGVVVNNQVSFLGGNTGKLFFEEGVSEPFTSTFYSADGGVLEAIPSVGVFGSIESFAEVVIPYDEFRVGYAITAFNKTNGKATYTLGNLASKNVYKTSPSGSLIVENSLKVTDLYDYSAKVYVDGDDESYSLTVGMVTDRRLEDLGLDVSLATTVNPIGTLTATNVYLDGGAEIAVNGALSVTGDFNLSSGAKATAQTMALKNVTMDDATLHSLQTLTITGILTSKDEGNAIITHRAPEKAGKKQLPYLTVGGTVNLTGADADKAQIKVTVLAPVGDAITGKKANNESWIIDYSNILNPDLAPANPTAPANDGAVLTAKTASAEAFVLADVHAGDFGEDGSDLFKIGTIVYAYDSSEMVVAVKEAGNSIGVFPTWKDAIAAIDARKDNSKNYDILILNDVGSETAPVPLVMPAYGFTINIMSASGRKSIYFTGDLALKRTTMITTVELVPLKKVGATYQPTLFNLNLGTNNLTLGGATQATAVVIRNMQTDTAGIGNIVGAASKTADGTLLLQRVTDETEKDDADADLSPVLIHGTATIKGFLSLMADRKIRFQKAATLDKVSLSDRSKLQGDMAVTIGNLYLTGVNSSANAPEIAVSRTAQNKCQLAINGAITRDNIDQQVVIEDNTAKRIDSLAGGTLDQDFINKKFDTYKVAELKNASPDFIKAASGIAYVKYKTGLYYVSNSFNLVAVTTRNGFSTSALDIAQAVDLINTLGNKDWDYVIRLKRSDEGYYSADHAIDPDLMDGVRSTGAMPMPGKDKCKSLTIRGEFDASHSTWIHLTGMGNIYGNVSIVDVGLVGINAKGLASPFKMTMKSNSGNVSKLTLENVQCGVLGTFISGIAGEKNCSELVVNKTLDSQMAGNAINGDISNLRCVTLRGSYDYSNANSDEKLQIANCPEMKINGSVTNVGDLICSGPVAIGKDLKLSGTLDLRSEKESGGQTGRNFLRVDGAFSATNIVDNSSGRATLVLRAKETKVGSKIYATNGMITGNIRTVAIDGKLKVSVATEEADVLFEENIRNGSVEGVKLLKAPKSSAEKITYYDQWASERVDADGVAAKDQIRVSNYSSTVVGIYSTVDGYLNACSKTSLTNEAVKVETNNGIKTYAMTYAEAIQIVDQLSAAGATAYTITLNPNSCETYLTKTGTTGTLYLPGKIGTGTLTIVGAESVGNGETRSPYSIARFDGTLNPTCSVVFKDLILAGSDKNGNYKFELNSSNVKNVVTFSGYTMAAPVKKEGNWDVDLSGLYKSRINFTKLSTTGTVCVTDFENAPKKIGGSLIFASEESKTLEVVGAAMTASKIGFVKLDSDCVLKGVPTIGSISGQSGRLLKVDANGAAKDNVPTISGTVENVSVQVEIDKQYAQVVINDLAEIAKPATGKMLVKAPALTAGSDISIVLKDALGGPKTLNLMASAAPGDFGELTLIGGVIYAINPGLEPVIQVLDENEQNVGFFYSWDQAVSVMDLQKNPAPYKMVLRTDIGDAANPLAAVKFPKYPTILTIESADTDSPNTISFKGNLALIGNTAFSNVVLDGYSKPNTRAAFSITVPKDKKLILNNVYSGDFSDTKLSNAIAKIGGTATSELVMTQDKSFNPSDTGYCYITTAAIDKFSSADVEILGDCFFGDESTYSRMDYPAFGSMSGITDLSVEGYVYLNGNLTATNLVLTDTGSSGYRTDLIAKGNLICDNVSSCRVGDGYDVEGAPFNRINLAAGTITIKKKLTLEAMQVIAGVGNKSTGIMKLNDIVLADISISYPDPSDADYEDIVECIDSILIAKADKKGIGQLTIDGTVTYGGCGSGAYLPSVLISMHLSENERFVYGDYEDESEGLRAYPISLKDGMKIATAPKLMTNSLWIDSRMHNNGSWMFYKKGKDLMIGNDFETEALVCYYDSTFRSSITSEYRTLEEAIADLANICADSVGTTIQITLYPTEDSDGDGIKDAISIRNASGALAALNLPARKNSYVNFNYWPQDGEPERLNLLYQGNLVCKSDSYFRNINFVPENAKGIPTAGNFSTGNFVVVLDGCSDLSPIDGSGLFKAVTGNAKTGLVTLYRSIIEAESLTNMSGLYLAYSEGAFEDDAETPFFYDSAYNSLTVTGNVSVGTLSLGWGPKPCGYIIEEGDNGYEVDPSEYDWADPYMKSLLRLGGNLTADSVEVGYLGCIGIAPGRTITVKNLAIGDDKQPIYICDYTAWGSGTRTVLDTALESQDIASLSSSESYITKTEAPGKLLILVEGEGIAKNTKILNLTMSKWNDKDGESILITDEGVMSDNAKAYDHYSLYSSGTAIRATCY